jgi:copper(I)-binding protein
MRYFLTLILCLSLGCLSQSVQARSSTSLIAKDGYAYPSLGLERPAAAFITIENQEVNPHQLLKVSAEDVSARAEIHTHRMENNVMKMEEVSPLAISGKTTIKFEDTHLHIMLIGLKKPLKVGDSFPLNLIFDRHVTQTITVTVRPRT